MLSPQGILDHLISQKKLRLKAQWFLTQGATERDGPFHLGVRRPPGGGAGRDQEKVRPERMDSVWGNNINLPGF